MTPRPNLTNANKGMTGLYRVILVLYRDNGKENGNYDIT